MADLVNRQHESIVSINDMSMETDTIICKPSSECHMTDVSTNSSDLDPCDGRNDLERENENSCSEDVKNFIDPVEELHERSLNFVSAGQIRARCSSAKNMPNSSQGKSLKRLSKADSDELNSDKESFKNSSDKKHSKPANFFKKSPGLALRLSENPIYNHDVTNGNYDDKEEEEDNQENIPESEDGCKNFCSEPGVLVLMDNCNDITNYELVKKEREEKLEKIARIDQLYQKQIESEMNAVMEAHHDEKLSAETKVQTTPSSHNETFDVPSVDHMVKVRKPNLLIDPSLAPKRKNPKTCRPVFSRFPGKSVNLPSVEDGLSSGNASGEDNDVGTNASGNDKPHCSFLNPLPVESPGKDEVDRQKSENLVDDDLELNEMEKRDMENIMENLNLKPTVAEVIVTDRSGDCKTSVDDRSTRSSLPTEGLRTDAVENSIRPLDEGIDYRDEDSDETKNIQSISAHDDTVTDCAREEDSVLENNIGRTSANVGEPGVDIAVAPTSSDVCGRDGPSDLSYGGDNDVGRDLFVSATNSSSEATAFPTSFSSAAESSTKASQGTDTFSEAIVDVPVPNLQSDALEFKSGLPSNGTQCDETEVERKVPTDFAQKYPKVPLPRIRTGSGCSPPTSLEVALKSLPPRKVECEVFELQPILGIPRKVPQVHGRSPSPIGGKFPDSNAEKPTPANTKLITHVVNRADGGQPAPNEDPSSSRPSCSGKDSNSSDDVENAIRDIKSAIMRSKNIKLSLPQQLEEVAANGQTEPVWITRQPQDMSRLYNRGPVTASSAIVKNFQGRQELANNTKSTLPSEDEGEKFSRHEDNYYVTKGASGFPVHGNYLQQFQGVAFPPSCNPFDDKPWASVGELNQGSPRIQNPFGRRLEVAGHLPASPLSGYGSTTFQAEAVEHVPHNCNRYDCYECRHLPDNFDEEDDDCENEDDEENGGEHNYYEEEEEEYDDETVEVVNNYVQVKPELDVASPCRIHGNRHHPLATGGSVHHCGMETSQPTGGQRCKNDGDGSVDRKLIPRNLPKSPSKRDRSSDNKYPEYSTDEETDNLLKKQYDQETPEEGSRRRETPPSKQTQFEQRRSKAREVALRDPSNESVLIEGVLFRANYLGSTQLISEGQPSKAMRMMQAQEAVGRIKAPDGESQPSTEVDLFVSVEKIMVLNTNLQEIMMDHALRTISYIADIGDILVIMARRGSVVKNSDSAGPRRTQTKICCHVFESEEAQLIAQSIGQAFQVSYVEFLKANGIEETSNVKNMDYQDVLNQQEVYGEELYMLSNKEMQREVIVSKVKGEPLGIVIVESGWGSMIPTVVLANMAPCGAAARCNQLNIGDQIISINRISMVGLPLTTCQSYIKAAKSQSIVKLTVVSCPPVVEVLIKRPDVKYQLGFSVQNGVICSLLRGGIAERGGVRVGHRIIEINGQSVVATHHEKIVNTLATSAGEIHMKTMPTSIFQLLTGQIVPHYI